MLTLEKMLPVLILNHPNGKSGRLSSEAQFWWNLKGCNRTFSEDYRPTTISPNHLGMKISVVCCNPSLNLRENEIRTVVIVIVVVLIIVAIVSLIVLVLVI
jgi:hypothetical protein